MDFSKLGQHERTAMIAAAVLVVAGLIAAATYAIYGFVWLAVVAALGLLFVVLQPQIAAGVQLPGSKGSLMVLLGGIAGAVMVLTLLARFGLVLVEFGFADIMFLAAVAAGVVAAWAGWQELQAEGGTFQLGSTTSGEAGSVAAPPPAAPTSRAPEPEASQADHGAEVQSPTGHEEPGRESQVLTDEPPPEERRTDI